MSPHPRASTRGSLPDARHARRARACADANDRRHAALAAARTPGLRSFAGAGHMGPLTHAAEVNALIVPHFAEAVLAVPSGRLTQ